MPQSEERTGSDLETAESVNDSDEVFTFRHIDIFIMLCTQNYVMQLTDEDAVVVAKAYFSPAVLPSQPHFHNGMTGLSY